MTDGPDPTRDMEDLSPTSLRDSGNPSHKIVSIAAGEAHTLALTGDGSVYSWGRGTFGRLGTGSEEDQLLPLRVNFPSYADKETKIVGVAAGAYHSLALSDDGSIWGWGYNIYGQLGASEENSLIPRLVEEFVELASPDSFKIESGHGDSTRLKVSSIKAGGMMSLAIDDAGGLWIWGNCPQPQQNTSTEGEFGLVSSSAPVPVWNFHGHTVVKVACGNEHVVALVTAGDAYGGGDLLCYSWGGNSHGQLGFGDTKSRSSPEVIETFNLDSPFEVYELACGSFHTALLTQKKRPSDTLESVCWTFGLGDNGQLGHGTTRTYPSPEPVEGLPKSAFLISVDCGLFHTSVVSSAGDVWSWGMENGLGLCPDARYAGLVSGDAVSPLLVACPGPHGPKFSEPLQVGCGAAHTVLVAEAGYKLWSWGRGRSGALGNGKTVDFYSPTVAMWPPLIEDFKEDEVKGSASVPKQDKETSSEEVVEMEKRVSAAMEEITLLRTKLSTMERYASILHGSIFGKPFEEQDIPASLQSSGTFETAKEWDNMLESSDRSRLVWLEMFYRNMLSGVKDKIMKKMIQEMLKECLASKTTNM